MGSPKAKLSDMSVHFSSDRMDWATPQAFVDELSEEFPFIFDVCATPENAKAKYYGYSDSVVENGDF